MATVAELILSIVGKDETSGALKSAKSNMEGFSSAVTKGSIAVSAAGVGIEALARSQQESNVIVGQNAAQIGMSEGEYRKLATSIANAGFPLEDVNALIRTGAQEGIQGNEQLKKYAGFWDDVGDATGLSATALAEGATGLRAVGIAAGEEGEALAAFGFITDHTKLGVDEFLGLLQKKGANLREFGISIDDTAAVLGVMEKELGLTGRAASTEFAEALDKSDGSMESLLANLGISQESFATMRAEVDASSGVIERNAEIQDKTITSTQKWKQALDEFLFTNAGVIKSVSDFAPIMMAAGPAVTGASTALRLMGPAAQIAAGGLRTIGMALLSPPLGIIIALVAVGVAAYVFRDEIMSAFKAVWEYVGPTVLAVRDAVVGAFNAVVEFARNNWPEIVTLISGPFFPIVALATDAFGIRSALVGAFNAVLTFLSGWATNLMTAFNNILTFFGEWGGNVVGFFAGIPGKITAAMGDMFGLGKRVIQAFIDGVLSMGGAVYNAAKSIGSKAFEGVKAGAGKLWPGSPSQAGIDLGYFFAEGIAVGMAQGSPIAAGAVDSLAQSMANSMNALRDGADEDTAFGFLTRGLLAVGFTADQIRPRLDALSAAWLKMAAAARSGAAASSGSNISWSTGLPRVIPPSPAPPPTPGGAGGTGGQQRWDGEKWVAGRAGDQPYDPVWNGVGGAGAVATRAYPRAGNGGGASGINVTMQNVTINTKQDAKAAADSVAFTIAANLRARGLMVTA